MTTFACDRAVAHPQQKPQGFGPPFVAALRPTEMPAGGPRRLGELLPAVLARHGLFCEPQSDGALGSPTRRRAPR